MLENKTDLAFGDMGIGTVLPVKNDFARIGLFKTGNDAQQGGFTAT